MGDSPEEGSGPCWWNQNQRLSREADNWHERSGRFPRPRAPGADDPGTPVEDAGLVKGVEYAAGKHHRR